jgi:hypothetical protein
METEIDNDFFEFLIECLDIQIKYLKNHLKLSKQLSDLFDN